MYVYSPIFRKTLMFSFWGGSSHAADLEDGTMPNSHLFPSSRLSYEGLRTPRGVLSKLLDVLVQEPPVIRINISNDSNPSEGLQSVVPHSWNPYRMCVSATLQRN